MKKLWQQHRLAVILASVISLAVLGSVFALLSRVSPPDPEKEPENAVRFIASDNFNRLSDKQKQEYLQQLRRPAEGGENRGPGGAFRNTELSEQERANLMSNMRPVFQAMQRERMEKFFAMSKEEQNQELDRVIQQMDSARARGQERRAQADTARRPDGSAPARDANRQDGAAPERRRGPTAQQMKERYENSHPLTRARLIEYRKAIRERRAGRR